ncbi:MAG: PD40 domain-containing protein [Anaerolineales bacterium]|nr:PD40 domain-containing protein [Anaerolineales bacterium]
MKRKSFYLTVLLMLLLLGLGGAIAQPAQTTAAETAEFVTAENLSGVIAYAGLDNSGRAVSIKRIDANGANPQTLYTLPDAGEISDVAWAPNGREVGFISSEEAAYSPFNQDIFAVHANGQTIRRISNPPRWRNLPNGAQTGVVQGTLRNNSGRNNVSIISLYIQGATTGAQIPMFNHLDTVNFSLNVADLGNGQMHYMVISWADGLGGPYKEIVPAIVDVLPGQTVNIGTFDFVGQTNQPNISDLSWNQNSSLVGVILENGSASPWQIDAAGEVVGNLMTDASLVSALAISPTDNRIAYYRNNGGEGVIALNQIGGTAATEQVILNDTIASLNYDRHIAWLPDGSGLVITVNGNIYDYIIATQDVRPLTSLSAGAKIDRVAVSPDGQFIAFSYSETAGVSDIYIMNRITSDITQLTTDGRSAFPSWSRTTPPTNWYIYIPMLNR